MVVFPRKGLSLVLLSPRGFGKRTRVLSLQEEWSLNAKGLGGLCSGGRGLLQGEAATAPPEVLSLKLGFPPTMCRLLAHMLMVIAGNSG